MQNLCTWIRTKHIFRCSSNHAQTIAACCLIEASDATMENEKTSLAQYCQATATLCCQATWVSDGNGTSGSFGIGQKGFGPWIRAWALTTKANQHVVFSHWVMHLKSRVRSYRRCVHHVGFRKKTWKPWFAVYVFFFLFCPFRFLTSSNNSVHSLCSFSVNE